YVDSLTVLNSDNGPLAILFSHACHPTTLGGDNLLITADFCGYACDFVSNAMEGQPVPFFLQGCAGNINPTPRESFEFAEMHGNRLGAAAIQASAGAEPLRGETVGYRSEIISLPLIPPPPPDVCQKQIEFWTQRLEEVKVSGDAGRILHAEGLL